MKKKFIGVWATFAFLDDTCDSITSLRKANFKGITTHSPFPQHEIEEALGNPQSRVPFFSLIGGLKGCFFATFLICMATLDWILPVSEKSIISIPSSIPIIFEATVIMAVEATVIGMLLLIYRSHKKHLFPTSKTYRDYTRFMRDRFGVVVPCKEEEIKDIQAIFQSYQAEEIYCEK